MARTQTQKVSGRRSKGGKPGNPGGFKGSRLRFLQARVAQYHSASAKKDYAPFWTDLFQDYWKTFPWHLARDVEPTVDNVVLEEEETPELISRKQVVMKTTNKVSSSIMLYLTGMLTVE